MNLNQVMHLMFSHTPTGSREHGCFVKGECQVTLVLMTNCGAYWTLSSCSEPKCECQGITPKWETDDPNPLPFLEQLNELGYSFKGWTSEQWDGKECDCNDKSPKLTIYKIQF